MVQKNLRLVLYVPYTFEDKYKMNEQSLSSRAPLSWAFDAAAVALIAAVLGFLALQPSPIFDELYHVLAARSWAEDGSVSIANGSYTRVILFTKMLGAVFSVLDPSLQTAKLLPLAGAVLLTVAMYCWVRATFGRMAAWVAVLLFVLSPGAIYMSQFVRFYSWHALAIWTFVIAFYSAFTGTYSMALRGALMLLGAAAWAMAYHFQPTTLIATVAFGLWVVVLWGPGHLVRIGALPRGGWILCGLGLIVILAFLGLWHFGIFAKAWAVARHTSPWQANVRDDLLYYHIYFLRNYPAFWALLPLAGLLSMRRNFSAGLLCTCLIVVAFVLHSIAGAKNYRYMHYAFPFFFILWGVALAEVLPAIYRLATSAASSFNERISAPRDLRKPLTLAVLALTLVFLLITNSAYLNSAALILRGDSRVHWSVAGWQAAAKRLGPEIDKTDILATSNGLFALYFIGRYDIDISPSQVAESATGEEFGRDGRTGSYAISKPESLAILMDCYPSGLYLSDSAWRWRNPNLGVSDEMADFLDANLEKIELPKDWMLNAYRWERPEDAPTPDSCPVLQGIGPDGADTPVPQD